MANNNIITLLCVFLCACGGGGGSGSSSPEQPSYRAEIMADLGLVDPIDETQAAIQARHFVSTNVVDSTYEPSIPSDHEQLHALYVSVKNREAKLQCSGMARVLQFMLNELGIQSKMVILASEEAIAYGLNYPQSSHVVLEAVTDKPIVLDAYFNASYQCQGVGNLLSADEMVACRYGVTWIKGDVFAIGRAAIDSVNFQHYLYQAIPSD